MFIWDASLHVSPEGVHVYLLKSYVNRTKFNFECKINEVHKPKILYEK